MKKVTIPSILVTNTYYWTPRGAASQRRSSEASQVGEVSKFLESIGFVKDPKGSGSFIINADESIKGAKEVVVNFSYEESVRNVYKHLFILVGGNNSNITGLIGQMKRRGIELIKP